MSAPIDILICDVQAKLGLVVDGNPGPITWQAIHDRIVGPSAAPVAAPHGTVLTGDGTWPFSAIVDGDDLLIRDVVITCFGGDADPQDDGTTASGINTKGNPAIAAVSVAMDGRQFKGLTAAEHRALDGCPIPRLPYHTLVEIEVGDKIIRPSAGIIDLGPGKQATTKPGEPHGADLTIAAARQLDITASAVDFEARGNVRILGGAKYVQA